MSERNLNFDEIIERRGTGCLKYDFTERNGMPEDVLPLWVADMDFRTSSYVEDAVVKRTRHGIFGYSDSGDEYFEAVAGWMRRHHHWDINKKWLVKTPGVVFAVAMAVKAYTMPGEAILIQEPVYYPFSQVIQDNERLAVSSNLYLGEDNRYHIDLEDFEKKITENRIKLFILCNPHNPTGRVFTVDELTAMGDICLKYNVTVVSDEIHSDFVFRGKHTVFASIKEEYQDISIICTAPSKTFNLAGLPVSNIFIANRELRKKFRQQMNAAGTDLVGALSLAAAQAAYTKGDEWYKNMLAYVRGNISFVKEYTEKSLPGISVVDGEGTYLVWLDFRKTGIQAEELERRIVYDAKLWLDSGRIFGSSGEGFQRINVAAPRKLIAECLESIRTGVLKLPDSEAGF